MEDRISLRGRVAIVTGGAGGIGSATARVMHARGAKVAVADINMERAEAVAAELGEDAAAIRLDQEDETSIIAMVEETVARFGRLDILHNNAVFAEAGRMTDVDVETMETALWDRAYKINIRGAMIACRQALPHMVRNGGGSIVNTVSIIALRGAGVHAAYASSKAALIQLTRSIASSHGRRGVRANSVAPGLTLTPAALNGLSQPVLDLAISETPAGRLGEPEDIAHAVAFLASDAARHINGQLIAVDGGLTCHLQGLGDLTPL
jgi:NAD(P)-dependent dehydrogenase (short-subunit alcohol dehydrogenase family)